MATASQKTTLIGLGGVVLAYLTRFLVLILGVLTAAPNRVDPVRKIPLEVSILCLPSGSYNGDSHGDRYSGVGPGVGIDAVECIQPLSGVIAKTHFS